jgi:hypothetical protein
MRDTIGSAVLLGLAAIAGGCGEGSSAGSRPGQGGTSSGTTGTGSITGTGTTSATGSSTGTGPIVGIEAGTPPPGNPGGCVNLQCQQQTCANGATTSVSGTVFAPNGTLPLYNVIVYVPNAPLEPFPIGITCDRCGTVASGRPIVSTLSNAEGAFELGNMPVGKNIPLVFQVGKWRRQITIPEVKACVDTPLTDHDQTRLPKNRKEGSMPHVAVTTGNCDNLSCLLPKLGVDPAELGIAGEDKAIIHYKGFSVDIGPSPIPGLDSLDAAKRGPPNMTPATNIWSSFDELEKYDMSIFSCECGEPAAEETPAGSFDAMTRYLAAGGRVFGTDYQYIWYNHSTDPKLAGAFTLKAGEHQGNGPLSLDTSFPKGKALADWMKFTDPSLTYGQLQPTGIFDHVMSVTPASQVWARSPSKETPDVHARVVTTNTPVGLPADQQCGRGVHLDLHITDLMAGPMQKSFVFPQDCGTTLNKGEQVLAFFFFDLSSCIQDDTKPPEPPPPPPPK